MPPSSPTGGSKPGQGFGSSLKAGLTVATPQTEDFSRTTSMSFENRALTPISGTENSRHSRWR